MAKKLRISIDVEFDVEPETRLVAVNDSGTIERAIENFLELDWMAEYVTATVEELADA